MDPGSSCRVAVCAMLIILICVMMMVAADCVCVAVCLGVNPVSVTGCDTEGVPPIMSKTRFVNLQTSVLIVFLSRLVHLFTSLAVTVMLSRSLLSSPFCTTSCQFSLPLLRIMLADKDGSSAAPRSSTFKWGSEVE